MQPRNSLIRAFALLGLFSFGDAALAAEKLYRWNDANGNPVVSDRPPPAGTPYTTLNPAKYGVGTAAKRALREEPVTASAPRASGIAEAEKALADGKNVEIEKNPQLCAQARDNIFKLETFPRMRVTDDDGTVRFMTDEERAQQLATAKEVAAANCED